MYLLFPCPPHHLHSPRHHRFGSQCRPSNMRMVGARGILRPHLRRPGIRVPLTCLPAMRQADPHIHYQIRLPLYCQIEAQSVIVAALEESRRVTGNLLQNKQQ